MSSIRVDRKRLAEYIKSNADVLAQRGDIYIDTDEVRRMDGNSSFICTVRLTLEQIPIEEVEVSE